MARRTKKATPTKAPRRRNVKPKRLAVSSVEYHELDLLSNSRLKLFAEDPEEYAAVCVHGSRTQKPPSPSFQFGTNVENWLFYGKLPDVALVPEEITDRKSKAFRDWKMAGNAGKKIKTVAEASRDEKLSHYFEIADNLQNHALADRLVYGDDVRIHDAIQWRDAKYNDVLRKCQLDLFAENEFIADVKTARSIDSDEFERDAYGFKYHWQAATYIDAVYEMYGVDLPFFWVVIKNSPGYGVEVFRASEEQIECGRAEYRAALKRWVACRDSGYWRSATYGLATETRLPYYVSARGVELKVKGKSVWVR